MLDLMRRSPWTELGSLHRDLDSLFGRLFGDVAPRGLDGVSPAAEVSREGDDWVVSLAVPGVDPKDVHVELTGRMLRVRGERRRERTADPQFSEVTYGQFERSFMLPDGIDADRVEASCRNGVLELRLPVTETARTRRIPVTSADEARQIKAA